MRPFGSGAVLAIAVLVGVVGVVAYNLGVSAGAADAAIAEGAAVIYAPAAISPFALLVGAFVLFLLIGLIVRATGGTRWGTGPGAWRSWRHDHHAWERGSVPEPWRTMLEGWHREAHRAATPAPAPGTTGGPQPRPKPPAGGPTPAR